MLLGLATIIGGTNPRAVGSILLFCFFAISHINHEIESGFIAKEQARLRSHIDIYENIINGTFLLSSPEQGEVVKGLKTSGADKAAVEAAAHIAEDLPVLGQLVGVVGHEVEVVLGRDVVVPPQGLREPSRFRDDVRVRKH